jgi:DNA-directed RNA polymerase subunit omega
VGPLVDSTIDDKPLSVAMHEINEDKLIATPIVEPAAS